MRSTFALILLLDVTRPDHQTSLVVGLMVAAAILLWLAVYLPARSRGRR